MVTTIRTTIPNLMDQFYKLKRKFPSLEGEVYKNKLRWVANLQPSSLSEKYKVQLEYSLEKSPLVFVKSPKIVRRGEECIPHLYSDGSLCLYLPRAQEWEKSMYLADTIVPWTAEWLFHYELWHATGEWLGGGVHLENTRKNKN